MKKGLVKRPADWRWSIYHNFALDEATVAECPIQIDDVECPWGPGVRKAHGQKITDRGDQ